MLFHKKKCTQCGSSYDVVDETCPTCHTPDEHYQELNIPKNLIWVSFVKQLILFGVGYLGLKILGLLAELCLMLFGIQNETTYAMAVNTIRYVGIFAAMIIILWNDFPKFRKTFARAFPYLIGLAGTAALIFSNIFINVIVSYFYTTSENANQTLANSMVAQYPILCIIVLGIMGPIVEEITYRLGLFTFFCRINKYAAYAITVVIFALIHFSFFNNTMEEFINELWNLPSYIVAGFLLTLWYDKFGLASSITAHIGNNLYAVIMTIILNYIK